MQSRHRRAPTRRRSARTSPRRAHCSRRFERRRESSLRRVRSRPHPTRDADRSGRAPKGRIAVACTFGIFDHIEDIPGTPTQQLFQDRLELDQARRRGRAARVPSRRAPRLRPLHGAEPGDLHRRRLADHDEQIRLGPMVKLLPLHHPVRIIEDMCVVDQLTGGRLDFGVGRGVAPIEHSWFGSTWTESKATVRGHARDHLRRVRDRRDLEREQHVLRLPDDAARRRSRSRTRSRSGTRATR